jgi:hypothetical protein
MTKLPAVALFASLALLTSCSSFSWKGQGSEVTPADASRGLKDVPTLTKDYETQKFFAGVRRRMDGRSNAFSRDLDNITATIDRHLFNYSVDDPYVNFPTEYDILDHSMRTAVKTVTPMPLGQEVMRR